MLEGPRHRTPDHATSVEGAASVAKRAPTQKLRLLAAYDFAGERGFTDEQAAHYAGLLGSCFWKRAGELRADGHIAQPEGEPVRKGTSNVSRIICCITQDGVDHLHSVLYRRK